MKFSFHKTTWENSIKTNLFLGLSNFALVGVTAACVVHMIGLKDRVVLVPPTITHEEMIGWNSANPEYYKSFGLYVAELVGNITPDNINFVANALSSFVDASIYPDIRKQMFSQSVTRQFRETAGATKYESSAIYYEPETNRVFVAGKMDLLNATQVSGAKSGSTPLVYEMKIIMREGRPVITALQSYEDSMPHDTRWTEQHQMVLDGQKAMAIKNAEKGGGV